MLSARPTSLKALDYPAPSCSENKAENGPMSRTIIRPMTVFKYIYADTNHHLFFSSISGMESLAQITHSMHAMQLVASWLALVAAAQAHCKFDP